MIQEDKELLLRYLSMALPYGVKVQDELGRVNKLVIGNADLIRLYYDDFSIYGENVLSLPLLRPMSSMTDEEKMEFDNFCVIDELVWKGNSDIGYKNQAIIMSNAIIWLLKKHFDFMDLIAKGLAIAVTKENNLYK